jgi:hypothetical protein
MCCVGTCCIDDGVILDEEGSNVQVAVAAGVVERDEAALVLGVHVRSLLQQILCHLRDTKNFTKVTEIPYFRNGT